MNPYLIFIIAILVLEYILKGLSNYLNIKHLKVALPFEFKGYYDSEAYSKSQKYLKANTSFGLYKDTFMLILTLVFILVGGYNWIDSIARTLEIGRVGTGLIFIGFFILGMQIINVPFSVYKTFVIEEKYSFNKTTWKTFILDLIKSLLLTVIIGGIVLSVILWFFYQAGSFAWFYCWIALIVFQLLLMFVFPALIMPLFNKFIPLEDGELKTRIEDFAKEQGFKMKGIFTMDGSKRSTKSNAFFAGFGKFRRIALFDTLIEKHTIDELISVLAHEIGHYKKKHIFKRMGISFAKSGLMLYIMSLFINNEMLFAAFRMEQFSVYASLVFFAFLYSPISMIISCFTKWLARKNEFEADQFAAETAKQPDVMITALKKMSVDNLANLTPHSLTVFLSYTHPPVLQRIERIRSLIKKNKGNVK